MDYKQLDLPVPGDVNLDGVVNGTDIIRVTNNFNHAGSVRWTDGDLNGDGVVGEADHDIAAANRTRTGPAAPDQTRTSDAANETTGISASGWVSPTYDAAGNMVSGPKAGDEATRLWYVYDAWNRLVAVKNDSSGSPGSALATYAYDGLNRRVSKTTGGHTDDSYFNENWQALEVRRDGDADAREQYVWEQTYVDTPAVRFLDANTDGDLSDAGDSTLYYLTDANHNVTAVFGAGTQQVAERYVYDAYGKATMYAPDWTAVRTASSVENSVLFAGYRFDPETQNFYARNRYYQSTTGQWINRDPILYEGGPNLYEYVGSSPISRSDSSGLRWDTRPAMDAPPTVIPGDQSGFQSPIFQPFVQWDVRIPAGLVRYTFSWNTIDLSTFTSLNRLDPSVMWVPPAGQPGEQLGKSEYYFGLATPMEFWFADIAVGATGEGLNLGTRAQDEQFNSRNDSRETFGSAVATVEVKEWWCGEVPDTGGKTLDQEGYDRPIYYNNVNRISDANLRTFPLAAKETIDTWNDRTTIYRRSIAVVWYQGWMTYSTEASGNV